MTSPAVQAAAEQVQAAWMKAGAHPMVHIHSQLQLLEHWPTLFHALTNLSDVLDREAAK